MSRFVVGAVQQRCDGTRGENIARSDHLIVEAASRGAQVVVLPELHTGPYFCQVEDRANFSLAEPVPGPTTEAFGQIAARHGVVLVASVFEQSEGHFFNTAVVLEADGQIAGTYRKSHIPEDPGFYEKFYFEPGDTGFLPIETSVAKLGVMVCWDQWFPEAARAMARAGAELLVYPTAIGIIPEDPIEGRRVYREAWQTIQRAHSVANGLSVVSVNRVGHEVVPGTRVGGITFWGHSFVTGPLGELVAEAGNDASVLVATIDRHATRETRETWPFWRDLRADYGNP